MPMVGMPTLSVTARATSSGTDSRTTEKAPAFSRFAASSTIRRASSASLPLTRNCPRPWIDWGVRPTWPMTGISASTMASTRRSRFFEAPSILTAAAPASLRKREALRTVSSALEVEREIGHVADDEGPPHGPGHGLGVVDHLVHGHGDRVLVPQDDHAQGVPDQDEVDPGLVQDRRRGEIVGRQADDLRAGGLPGPEGGDGDALTSQVSGMFRPFSPPRLAAGLR